LSIALPRVAVRALVGWTLRAKALDWESVKVDLLKAEQYDPKSLKLNPRGNSHLLAAHRITYIVKRQHGCPRDPSADYRGTN